MKLSTVAGVAGLVALGYLAYRCINGESNVVDAEFEEVKEPALLPAPSAETTAE
ncbi:hypothetical protein [Pseudomonas phage D6]|nr:hypothetical protein [Pseudomonas phage D6]